MEKRRFALQCSRGPAKNGVVAPHDGPVWILGRQVFAGVSCKDNFSRYHGWSKQALVRIQ